MQSGTKSIYTSSSLFLTWKCFESIHTTFEKDKESYSVLKKKYIYFGILHDNPILPLFFMTYISFFLTGISNYYYKTPPSPREYV